MATTINNVKLKKCNVNGVKCKHINVNGVNVWNSSVTLNNLIGSSLQLVRYTYADHGSTSATQNGTAISTISGHRYYVRARTYVSAQPCSHGYTNTYGKATAKFVSNIVSSTNNQYTTNHAIVTATSNSTYPQVAITRADSDQGHMDATFYMVVDLTELEDTAGKTYTADDFWSLIGSDVFYNSKEVEV